MSRNSLLALLIFPLATLAAPPSIPTMIPIAGGYFYMGSDGYGKNFDEAPIHHVTLSPFSISATEITNSMYEQFDSAHRSLRGLDNVSTLDNEPVVNVSYHDAIAYCQWLSHATGRHFRLPTEAEWEYACRAGSYTRYNTGDWLPDSHQRNQVIARDYQPVNLTVATSPANAWGIYDMHGNVEEWCLDSYAPYSPNSVTNPLILDASAPFRITRGGSHHTPIEFLRSANRSATLPSDRNSLIGFRIVESFTPLSPSTPPRRHLTDSISQKPHPWTSATSTDPLFIPPIPFVIPPLDNTTPFYHHNHQPAITWCPNGDLLAIWFSADAENGREIALLSSRLTPGANSWTPATLFYQVPDRNLTGSSLLTSGSTIIHLNGLEAAGDWQNLAIIRRFSHDNGATWTNAEFVNPRHSRRHQIIAGPIITHRGTIVQLCDAGPDGNAGSAIHLSHDNALTFVDQCTHPTSPSGFKADSTGTLIAGIHAGVVELADGSLLALGRGNSIPDSTGTPRMPMSISRDMGQTWHYSASPFPPIDGGQRLVLMRLHEGPIMLISFTDHPQRTPQSQRGMIFTRSDSTQFLGHGLYVALSYDEGHTWPVRKLLTDGQTRFLNGGAWTGYFEADETHSEPRGYLAATQTPDGIIHLLSSRLHYRFNLPWLQTIPSPHLK